MFITFYEAGKRRRVKYLNVTRKERDRIITEANIPHDHMDKFPDVEVQINAR